MRWQKNKFQMKKHAKTPEELSEVEKDNLPYKELRVMIVKMIKGLRRKIHEHSRKLEVLNKELENTKKSIE